MVNLLWSFIGALARALLPLVIKGSIRIASKFGRVYIRQGWRGLRTQMLKMFTSRAGRKKARDSKSRGAGRKEISEMDGAGETDI